MKNVQAYKTIGEVEKVLKVKPHVLRFWEESFSQVKPLKRKGGRRLYSEDVINILRIIKKLVSDEGYSIRGVKKYLSKNKISDLKKEGAIKISEELDIKLDNIEKYLKKAKRIIVDEKKKIKNFSISYVFNSISNSLCKFF